MDYESSAFIERGKPNMHNEKPDQLFVKTTMKVVKRE